MAGSQVTKIWGVGGEVKPDLDRLGLHHDMASQSPFFVEKANEGAFLFKDHSSVPF